jgi:hypothetical protein
MASDRRRALARGFDRCDVRFLAPRRDPSTDGSFEEAASTDGAAEEVDVAADDCIEAGIEAAIESGAEPGAQVEVDCGAAAKHGEDGSSAGWWAEAAAAAAAAARRLWYGAGTGCAAGGAAAASSAGVGGARRGDGGTAPACDSGRGKTPVKDRTSLNEARVRVEKARLDEVDGGSGSIACPNTRPVAAAATAVPVPTSCRAQACQ